MKDLSAQRVAARNALPEKTLAADAAYLEKFEVLLAYNLEHPYRYCQDYWWLEVLAQDMLEAKTIARDWVIENSNKHFECTDLVRIMTDHYPDFTSNKYGKIEVNWDIAVEKKLLPTTALRNPSSGKRVGYLAGHKREEEVLASFPEKAREGFRLLLERPLDSSRIVCLAPEVINTSPLYQTIF
jgi:hypothetical protein